MSRPFNKGDFSDDSNDAPAVQDEEDIVYKAKAYWSGQGDNDLTVLPSDILETKAANLSKPGCIYVYSRRTGTQGFVPKSLVKKEPASTHIARGIETSYHDEKSNVGSERRVRFQSPLKANSDESGKSITANRDLELPRTHTLSESQVLSKEDRFDDKNSGYARLNDHKMDYLNLCNTNWRNQSAKSGLMSRMEHSAYVDVNKSVISKGLPSFSKLKLPSSSHSRGEQCSEYVERSPLFKLFPDSGQPFKSKLGADTKLYPSGPPPGTTSASQNKSLPFRNAQQIGIPLTNADSNSAYSQHSVPNYFVDQTHQTYEKPKAPVAPSNVITNAVYEHQLTPVYFITPILCQHCNDYIWGSGIVGHRCEMNLSMQDFDFFHNWKLAPIRAQSLRNNISLAQAKLVPGPTYWKNQNLVWRCLLASKEYFKCLSRVFITN